MQVLTIVLLVVLGPEAGARPVGEAGLVQLHLALCSSQPLSHRTTLHLLIDKLLQALLHLNKSSIGVCPVHPPPTTTTTTHINFT